MSSDLNFEGSLFSRALTNSDNFSFRGENLPILFCITNDSLFGRDMYCISVVITGHDVWKFFVSTIIILEKPFALCNNFYD